MITLSIDETLIDKNDIALSNCNKSEMQETQKSWWRNFGFECMLNDRNEPIIVMIDDLNPLAQDIHLFNCVTHEFTEKNVCTLLPSSAMMNHIIYAAIFAEVLQNRLFFACFFCCYS